MRIAANQTLLFIGDSITDAGRARPVGEGNGLGGGYVAQVQALLTAVYPQLHTRVLNTGISGNQVRHLRDRWQTDVLDLKPDWLSIMIGTNDVWRQFDKIEAPTLPDAFESIYADLIERTKPTVRGGLVLLTPFYIQPDRSEPMRARMDEYGAIVARLARKYDARFVDTQAAYDKALRAVPYDVLAGDRVHPSAAGHALLARGFLKAVGFAY
jgi:lysophospholipase L1-like esterase